MNYDQMFFSIKRTIERCVSEPITQNERYRSKKPNDVSGQTLAHLNQVEQITRIFLKSANTSLDDSFIKKFRRQSEER